MRRDVQEGRARCLAHLGRHAEALAIATDLVSGLIAFLTCFPKVVEYILKNKTKQKPASCSQQGL